MRIGINTRHLLPNKLEGFGQYTLEIVGRLIKNHPEHEFVLFFDREKDAQFDFGSKVTTAVLSPAARHPILYLIWFEILLPRALKKHKIDLFFSPDGYASLLSSVQQIIVIHDINFEHNPKDLPSILGNYLRYFFPKFAKKATKIITVSEYSKQDIVKTYEIDPSKIEVIYNAANSNYKPISKEEQELVKKQFTDGADFLLFVGSLHPRKNIQRLISAFELIHKNHPKLKLLIVGANMWRGTSLNLSPEMSNYVHFTGHLNQELLTKVMASALMLTYVPYFEGFGIPMVEAMNCGTVVLASRATCLPEIAGDAAYLVDPFDINDIAKGINQLIEDESLRAEFSKKGLQRSTYFSWDKAAEELAKVLGL